MKTRKRILTILIVIIAIVMAIGMIFLNNLKTRAVPDYNEDVDLAYLTDKVTVYRDSLGIPHIYAQNDLDLCRTIGYVMAQDRLWQMDLLRRITTGRLSEVLDPDLVDADQLFRALQFSKKSALVIAKTDPKVIECLEAYCDGVNQFIDSHQKKLPFEFAMLGYKPDQWELIHSINLIGYMHWDLAMGWGTEMALFKMQQVLDSARFQELLPDMEYQNTHVYPGFRCNGKSIELQSGMDDAIRIVKDLGLEVFQASNNWAVSGTRSKTGMPLLANDMHLGLMAPGIWYQMHQVVEGSLNVSGEVLPGQPYVVAGHNQDIAWGFTNVMVDDTDFYLETVNPADTNQYKLDGQWKEMELVEEQIVVKGLDEPVTRVNRFTHRGPVISGFKGVDDRVISLRWQGNEYSNEFRALYLLHRAANWNEFRDALSTFYVGQNVIYSDRFGNIGLQTVAGIPIRKGDQFLVYPGDTSLYDWTGQVPFEELPYSLNPECGYVSSANNRTVDDDYPYYISTWFALPYRIERIREMLDSQPEHGVEDFKRMLRDQTSHFAKKMTPFYLEALEGHTDGIYEKAFTELKLWDYNMEATSSAALIFEIIWLELHRVMFGDELGEELYPLMIGNSSIPRNLINKIVSTGESAWCDDVATEGVTETFTDNIQTAFSQAVDTIASLYGEDPENWMWGDLHKVSLIHPMGGVAIVDKLFGVNRGPFPIGGSFHTVCPYSYPLGKSFVANHGASERHIFNTANWDKSLTVIPTGTSGVPASPHYLDQTALYVNNLFHNDPFSREAVESSMKYKAVFE
ncbi:MAG: penicillin acylase family protein [Bacteroidetes bacterium]|nr:penicillin acylase family protein [Bacteroidota bacterium]